MRDIENTVISYGNSIFRTDSDDEKCPECEDPEYDEYLN